MIIPAIFGVGLAASLSNDHIHENSFTVGYELTEENVASVVELDTMISEVNDILFKSSILIFIIVFFVSLICQRAGGKLADAINLFRRKYNPDVGVVTISLESIGQAKNIYHLKNHDFCEDDFKRSIRKLISSRTIYRGFHKVGPVYVYLMRENWINPASKDIKGYVMVESIESINMGAFNTPLN